MPASRNETSLAFSSPSRGPASSCRRALHAPRVALTLLAATLGSAVSRRGLAAESATRSPAGAPGSTSEAPGEGAHTATQAEPKWYAGSVEQAFETARKANKPLFLYWGAVWCPPCNEIKAQVFSKRRFLELSERVVPVYLDGDGDAAQIWSDKLKVSGYPTLLLLTPDGKEVMRFTENVNIEEFETAFESAITTNRPFKETLARARSGSANKEDWRVLSFYSWGDPSHDAGLSGDEVLAVRKEIVDKAPAGEPTVKAALAASLLEAASRTDAKDAAAQVKANLAAVRASLPALLDAIFATPETAVAARRVLLYSAGDIVRWAHADAKGEAKERAALVARWNAAVAVIAANETLSIDTRLWALYPEIQFAKLDDPKAQVPQALATRVRDAVAKADADATSAYVRHAVISGAAHLLSEVGDRAAGRALLVKELKTTNTPWYTQSALASLEKDAGDMKEALKWSAESVASAKGNSTRLQWMAADIALNLKADAEARLKSESKTKTKPGSQAKAFDAKLKKKLDAYYGLALTLPDGFAGRNAGRQKKLAQGLNAWAQTKTNKSYLASRAKKCAPLAPETREACEKHFDAATAPLKAAMK